MPEVLDGKDEAVTKAIKAGIDQVNKKSESNAKRIAKFTILPEDFSIGGGELGQWVTLIQLLCTQLIILSRHISRRVIIQMLTL